MNLEFFTPVNHELLDELTGMEHCLGKKISVHTENSLPELGGVKIALFGVLEDRLDIKGVQQPFDFSGIRRQLYQLYPGNWDVKLADLGDIQRGESVEDTYYAVREIVADLVKADIIPIILGGSQDLMYSQYRAYDQLDRMVNIVNVDSRFDLGDIEAPISNRSFMGKVVVEKPYNLINYAAIGYQTYFNSQNEIELMDKLFFDAYRLGEISGDISVVEPVMRDADIVGIDIGVLSAVAIGDVYMPSPNGFDGKEFCALSRYAGISDRVSSFGIYEYTATHNRPACNMLIAQALWYFVEGVNYRRDEDNQIAQDDFIKYQVPVDDEILVFYKSPLSGRWWIEIPLEYRMNNNLTRNALLPCAESEYLSACNQIIPERWYKTKRKSQV